MPTVDKLPKHVTQLPIFLSLFTASIYVFQLSKWVKNKDFSHLAYSVLFGSFFSNIIHLYIALQVRRITGSIGNTLSSLINLFSITILLLFKYTFDSKKQIKHS